MFLIEDKVNAMMIKALLIISACFVMTVEMYPDMDLPSEPYEELDPHDMLRYDSARKRMLPKYKPQRKVIEDKYGVTKMNSDQQCSSKMTFVTKGELVDEMDCDNQRKTGSELSSSHMDTTNLKQNKDCICDCADCEIYFYKRYVGYLLNHFKYEAIDEEHEETFFVKVEISKKDITTLEKFVSRNKKVAIQDIDEILTHLFKEVKADNPNFTFEQATTWVNRLMNWITENIFFVGAVLAIVFAWRLTNNATPLKIFTLGMMVIFSISVAFQYIHLIQKAEVKKFADRMKFSNIPAECNPEAASTLKYIWWTLKYDILNAKNPCESYYEAVMIDTKYEVNPMMALTSTIGQVMEVFSKYLGSSLGLFYVNLLNHFSWIMKMFIIVAGTIVILFIIRYMGPELLRASLAVTNYAHNNRERNRIEDVNENNNPRPGRAIQEEAATPPRTVINQYYLMNREGSSTCLRTARETAEAATQDALKLAHEVERLQCLDSKATCSKYEQNLASATSDTEGTREKSVTGETVLESDKCTSTGDCKHKVENSKIMVSSK